MKEISEKIKEARKSKNMSCSELAYKANLSTVVIYYIEKGKMPSFRTLSKVCEVLGLKITVTDK